MMKNGAKPGRTLLRKRNRKEKEDFDSEDATIILPSSRGAPETKHPTGRKKHGALLFFVFLSVFSILTFRLPRRTSSIPKLIWFTSKASTIEKLPDNHTLCVDSWRRLNPEYQIRYHNDSEAEFFMCSSLPSEYCEAYRQLPLPVMKADMWRYAILYVHGGVYADINAENRIPIREWAAAENCGFWAGQENNHHLCQWTIAAAPGNHALKQVLDLIVERVAQSDSTKHFADQHFVHELTGPKVFTDGVELSLPVRLTTPFESFNEWTRTWRIRLSSWVTKGDICIASQHAIRYEPKKGYSTGYVDNHLEWTTGWKRQARKFRNKLKKQAVNESISSLRPNPLPTK